MSNTCPHYCSLERNPKQRASIPSLLNHPFIRQYRDVDLVEEFRPLVEEAIEQNSRDRETSKEISVLQFLKEDILKRRDDESGFSDGAMTPLSCIQYNNVSNHSSPHPPIPSFPSTGIPLVALNVYQQMQKQKEAEAQAKGINLLLDEDLDLVSDDDDKDNDDDKDKDKDDNDDDDEPLPTEESLTESLIECYSFIDTLQFLEDLSSEDLSSEESVEIQNTVLIPPDNVDCSTCLSPICPLPLETIKLEYFLKQIEEDTWEGVATPTYHSGHGSYDDDRYSLCNIADSTRSDDVVSFVDSFSDFHTEPPFRPVSRSHISLSNCDNNLPVTAAIEDTPEEEEDHFVKAEYVSPPHVMPITKPIPIMETDIIHDGVTTDEEFPQLCSTPTSESVSVIEIDDPVFMCPKLTSERKLADRITRRPLSWRQRFIRAWNRCVRWCFGKRKRDNSSRQTHHRRYGCCGRKR